jgi:hypothetical protein
MEVPISNYCIDGGGGGTVRSGINVSTLQKNPFPSPPGGTSWWKQLSFESLVNCSNFLLKCYVIVIQTQRLHQSQKPSYDMLEFIKLHISAQL